MRGSIPLGMVGGGPESFIGPVHRMASQLDGRFRLVAGVFSGDPERCRRAGEAYGIDPDRCYSSHEAMIAAETAREGGIRAVAVATPNHAHLAPAVAALAAGLHVISEKPATASLEEAFSLERAVSKSSALFALTYTYTGYPMVREARARVAQGELGRVRKVVVEYPQGWLSSPLEQSGHKQAGWRSDPRFAGPGGAIGDIGVHAFNLAEYVSGERVESFVAQLSSLVEGRRLDDDCNVLLRFAGGQPGLLLASQASTGERNGVNIRVYGSEGMLYWSHHRPERLVLAHANGREESVFAGMPGTAGPARLPTGHPEGYIEAFANIYSDVADAIEGREGVIDALVPGIRAGVRGMRFIERAVAASQAGAGWTRLEE